MTLVTLEAGAVVDEHDGGLAARAREYIEEFGVEPHTVTSLREVWTHYTKLHRSARRLDVYLVGKPNLWNNRHVMRRWLARCVLAVLVALPTLVFAQSTVDAKAEAYRLYLLARHLEGEGDVEGAIRSYREAAKLDTESGEILGELATLYAHQNRSEPAIAIANEALKRDPVNLTAHRILGLLYARQSAEANAGSSDIARAIEHLEQARETLLPDVQVELTLARLYLANASATDAINLLEELLKDEMRLNEAGRLLAQAYEQTGRVDDALSTLEGLIQGDRPSSRTLNQLGQLYERVDRWSDAAAMYERAVHRNPREIGTRRRLANALLEEGEVARARDVLRELLSMRPEHTAGLYLLSQVELDLNNFSEAESAAQRLIDAEPDGIRGAYALSKVFGRRREHQRVIDILKPALEAARQRNNVSADQAASLLARLGFAYEQLPNHERAAEVYRDAVTLMPNSLVFEARLAEAYLESGRVTDALEIVQQARARHPNNVTLARLQARALDEGGDIDAGADVLREVLAANDRKPTAYIALADYYSAHDRFADAVKLLELAEDRFPADTSILFQLGAVFERHDSFLDAEAAFRRILDREPDHAATLNYLGYLLADRGERIEESIGLLKRAIQIDPYNGAYLDSLGWAYFKLERLDLAETNLRQASEQMAKNSVIQDHFGDLMFKLDRYAEAISAWERALAGDGEEINPTTIERKIDNARELFRR